MDVEHFIAEDVGHGDVTTDILVPDVGGKAEITCESDAVMAGLGEAITIFEHRGVRCFPFVTDGERVKKGTAVLGLSGPLKEIMTMERTALNFMMRMSGIATETNDIVTECRKINGNVRISGTRKTTPGFRYFEKKAIVLGGGDPHRRSLDEMILVKDNHIKAAGGMRNVVDLLRKARPGKKIEIEAENIEDAVTAAEIADIIMIDNAGPAEAEKMADAVRKIGNIVIEVSGNITKDNVADYAGFADVISMGSLTHSVRSVHFSLNVE
ncbi:MAG: carboxylating nicotinate-nucleotide diphosphorylase [Methanomassiliicoccaceae archaeon]|nr:carboxylating nicotinate-nucleotide diphosphorylase [Methanomassiliicoccaceae archaeon]